MSAKPAAASWRTIRMVAIRGTRSDAEALTNCEHAGEAGPGLISAWGKSARSAPAGWMNIAVSGRIRRTQRSQDKPVRRRGVGLEQGVAAKVAATT